jgi:hypothetical protein
MNKQDKAMGDLDKASSPSGPSSPNNPDNASKFITHANYGSETPKSMAQDVVNSGHSMHSGYGDQTAQHVKMSHERKLHVRNTALNEAETQHGTPKMPSYQHGDPDY